MNKSETAVSKEVEGKDKSSIASNGLVIFCAIVSIVTCCFSLNLAESQYHKSAAKLKKFHQQLLEEKSQLKTVETAPAPLSQNVSHEKSL